MGASPVGAALSGVRGPVATPPIATWTHSDPFCFSTGRRGVVAPSSTDARLASTAGACRGFVYAASTMGVTGGRTAVDDAARILVERTRKVSDIPVCVGLGVSTADQAAEVAGYADGVIVGSVFVRALADAPDTAAGLAAVRALASDLAEGVRRGRRA